MRRVSFLIVALVVGALTQSVNATPISYVTDTETFGTNGVHLDMFESVSWTHTFSLPPNSTLKSGVLAVNLADDDLWDGIEIGFGFADSGQWAIGAVSTGTYKFDIALNSLLDGSLSITLASLWGDFVLKSSKLTVGYTSVPEPATLSLLGIGVLGAAFGYRRRPRKTA